MPEFYGIDVSRYQGAINWQKVKAAGKAFAIVKLGWAGWEGSISVDANALTNIQGAIAAGLHVGVYVYSYCKTPAAAKIAAQETLKLIRPHKLEYPMAFDIEDTSDSGVRYDKMSRAANSEIAAAFLDEIEKAGYYGILYTYKSFAENYLDMASLKKYDVWIAQYAAKCTYAGPYGMWQYIGDDGRCDGITGPCDLNVAYMDYAKIIKSAGLNGFTKPTETPSSTEPSELDRLREDNARLRQNVIDLNYEITKRDDGIASLKTKITTAIAALR